MEVSPVGSLLSLSYHSAWVALSSLLSPNSSQYSPLKL